MCDTIPSSPVPGPGKVLQVTEQTSGIRTVFPRCEAQAPGIQGFYRPPGEPTGFVGPESNPGLPWDLAQVEISTKWLEENRGQPCAILILAEARSSEKSKNHFRNATRGEAPDAVLLAPW
jgi:hypothetical protein